MIIQGKDGKIEFEKGGTYSFEGNWLSVVYPSTSTDFPITCDGRKFRSVGFLFISEVNCQWRNYRRFKVICNRYRYVMPRKIARAKKKLRIEDEP